MTHHDIYRLYRTPSERKSPGIRSFIWRILMTLFIPVTIPAAIYMTVDPFKVITRYDAKTVGNAVGDNLKLSVNKGMLSVQALERRINDGDIPDSFIFGASISCYYEVDYWQEKTGTTITPIHFDSSSEGARSLRHKIEYLISKGLKPRNALVIIDPVTIGYDLEGDDIMSADPPQIAGWWTWPQWHTRFMKAFFDPDFLISYLPSQLVGTTRKYGFNEIFDRQPSIYDVYRNEESIPQWDEEIRRQPAIFYAYRNFPDKREPHCSNENRIDENREREYRLIARLLAGTDYHVAVSPVLDCDTLSQRDASLLSEIFGHDRFHDFSARMTHVAQCDSNWYDTRHYRAPVARAIMDSIYR